MYGGKNMKKMMSFLLATALTVGMTAGVAATTYAEEDKKSVGFVTFGLGGDFFCPDRSL